MKITSVFVEPFSFPWKHLSDQSPWLSKPVTLCQAGTSAGTDPYPRSESQGPGGQGYSGVRCRENPDGIGESVEPSLRGSREARVVRGHAWQAMATVWVDDVSTQATQSTL